MKYLLVIATLLLFNSSLPSFAQQIGQISEIETRVVAICSGVPDTSNVVGSGFIAAEDGLIVTADHVIFEEQKNRAYDKLFCVWPTYPEPLCFRLSIVKRFKQGMRGRDIALLRIDTGKRDGQFPFLEIGDDFEIGDPVLIAGFPFVFNKIYHWPLFRKGTIASTRYKYQNNRIIVLDLPAVDGYSGSPVFNLRSRKVIGIVKGSSAQRKGAGFSVALVIEKGDLEY